MTCPRPLCGQPMAVDREFEVEAVAHGVPKRRWTDLRGHEVIEEGVARETSGRTLPAVVPPPRPCRECGRMITSPARENQAYHVTCTQKFTPKFTPRKRGPLKAVCVRGHRFTEKNTYIDPQGHRRCVTCRRVHDAARAQHRTRRS